MYQNEIAPIFYYGISTKTNEKDLKIHNLQPPEWKSPYWMTLYFQFPAKMTKLKSGDQEDGGMMFKIDLWEL